MVALHEPIEETVRRELSEYDDLTAALLSRRGITTREEAVAFLSPSYEEHIGNPMHILDMPKAAARIAAAIHAGERITVWSDYDCDGIPGGSLLHDFLKKAGANFDNYIPHRHEEGFGVSVLGVEKLREAGTKLLITVDCGITDNDAVARANELGMDVIITDHHLPGEHLPPALAIIDPKARKEETYPFKELCGAGLAWKLACGVLAHGFTGRENIPVGWEKWLLDMAGLATIADMVPLVGENRVIAKYGLLVMRKSPRLGLHALCRTARVNQRFITEDDVGFMLAPRINAASRMGNPRDAFELFTTTDEARANELALLLEKANRSRRAQAAAITRAVHDRLEERALTGALPAVIALGDPDWRPGLLGLVANSIAEEYERPVFLWGREGGTVLKGSCRTGNQNISVVVLMEHAPQLFDGFGGHAASGGFTLKDDAVFSFEDSLVHACAALPHTETNDIGARADGELSTLEATNDLLNRLARLAPFGIGNEKPLFVLRNVNLTKVSWFGKSEEHLKVALTTDGFDAIEGISFYAKRELGKKVHTLSQGKNVSMLASLERDQFSRGRPVRLRLVAIA
ncbi:single-stranded-DNA-specific exonuclease RecJ [Candidatus Parcubacteria bacterium]|nr:single-stranded-DNA-specific exonuclease RecJ [Candidatus Parcubacteria bacterium]